jgi:membrane-bound serine protease (ClpP class)
LVLLAAVAVMSPQIVAAQTDTVYRVVVSGVVELGLAPFIARSLDEAHAAGAAAVILEFETPGGRVDAAQRIVKSIAASEVPVYAFVNQRAISAGAMIALAADSIFMGRASSIGAATPIVGSGEKASEKIVSVMRSEFRALAERRGLDPRIAEAMVDEEIAIEGVVEAGKLLTLTGSEAVELDVAAAEVETLEALLDQLGLPDAEVYSPSVNWAEALVRFLSHPVVAPILLSLGTLGIIIELKTPTFGIAGIVGLSAFSAFFGSHLLIGLAGWEELILLGIGLVALVFEVFVVPGFGIAGIVSIVCIGGAVFLALLGSLPTWADVARAGGVLAAATLIVIGAGYAIVRHLPSNSRLRGFFLDATMRKDRGFISAPARADLVGEVGVAATDLRPSGVAVIGSERLDVVSDAGYIAKGAQVKVIQSDGNRLVVRPAEDQLSA